MKNVKRFAEAEKNRQAGDKKLFEMTVTPNQKIEALDKKNRPKS